MAQALNGLETLQVLGQAAGQPAATTFQTTTGAIAALAATEGAPFVSTAITTVGNGTLTAAGLVGGQIVRTGPVANFTDTTDTAASIVAAGPLVGSSFSILLKNATAFTQTIQAGSGVTLPATVIVPAFSVANYICNVTSATTATLIHIDTTPISIGANMTAPAITALSTVGAGTVLAAAFVGGLIARGGSQSSTAFIDTTDIAANIIAACANLVNKIGTSMLIEYANNTNATATLQGGTGVTVSGTSVIPPNTVGQFLLTYTAAATLTMVGVGVTQTVASSLTILGSSTGTNAIATANSGTSNFTNTLPAASGVVALNGSPILAGSTLAVTAAMTNQVVLLNTSAGSVATLPAATGSGSVYKFIVTTTATSNAHKILAASSSDFLNGNATGHVAAGTSLSFSAAASTAHSIQMPFAGTQPSGGFIGDWFEFTDVAANLWHVRGAYLSGTTSTTPFSASTS